MESNEPGMKSMPIVTLGARTKLLRRKDKKRAAELISQITDENCHPEISTGYAVGNEIIDDEFSETIVHHE